MLHKKYPHTPYLPFTKSRDPKDVMASDMSCFIWADGSREVVVTEKMDGERFSLYQDGLHARSVDSLFHESHAWLKAHWAGQVSSVLSADEVLLVENVYARHSVSYESLESYAFIFGAMRGDVFLSWEEVSLFADAVSLPVAPVLFRGAWSEEVAVDLVNSLNPEVSEGFVVRSSDSFVESEFGSNVAKYVRAGHVQSEVHWKRDWIPNALK